MVVYATNRYLLHGTPKTCQKPQQKPAKNLLKIPHRQKSVWITQKSFVKTLT